MAARGVRECSTGLGASHPAPLPALSLHGSGVDSVGALTEAMGKAAQSSALLPTLRTGRWLRDGA